MSGTLVFCTAHSTSDEVWTMRYRLWLNAILGSQIIQDHILLVDDASPVSPNWSDIRLTNKVNESLGSNRATLYRFDVRLGRIGQNIDPGWSRSFCFAAHFAQTHGFDKVVHIESDAFVISSRMQRYINEVSDGWVAPYIQSHDMPESAIQVIAGRGARDYFDFSREPYSKSLGMEAARVLPFTHVERAFLGSRCGGTMTSVPRDDDFVTQAKPAILGGKEYYWWLPLELFPFP